MAKEKTQYVLCISDDREYERLRKVVAEQLPDAEAVQSIPVGYLTRETELFCGFFEGNGNIKDERGNQIERVPVITEAVKVADHWTPGAKGKFGSVRLADFLTSLSANTAPRNATVRHYNDELTLGYG